MNVADRAVARDRYLRSGRVLGLMVMVGVAAAALTAFAYDPGSGPASVVSLHGQTVALEGHGLYRSDSVAFAAQARAQDAVTLVVALPLLAVAWWITRRGAQSARVLLAGTYLYFLYAYAVFALGVAYNELVYLYILLFAASLFGAIFSFLSVDAAELGRASRARFPRRAAAALMATLGVLLAVNWLGVEAGPDTLVGRKPLGLGHYTTIPLQVLDLGVAMPVSLLGAFWLWRRDPRGYLLGTAWLIKIGLTSLAVVVMIAEMGRVGVVTAVDRVLFFLFLAFSLGAGVTAARALRSFAAPSG